MLRKISQSQIRFGVIILCIIFGLLTIIRLFGEGSLNDKFDIGYNEDGEIWLQENTELVSEFVWDEKYGQITGISFRYTSSTQNFEDAELEIKVENVKTSDIMYDESLYLRDQIYDYQIEQYKVIIPFKGELDSGDTVRLTIVGRNILDEMGIVIKTSSNSLVDSQLMLNGVIQNGHLVSSVYYTRVYTEYAQIIIQGISLIFLLIFLYKLYIYSQSVSSLKPSKKILKKPLKAISWGEIKHNILNVKFLLKGIFLLILLIVCFEYVYYAGIKERANDIFDVAYTSMNDNSEESLEINNNSEIKYSFIADRNYLMGIAFFITQLPEEDCPITIKLYENDEQSEIYVAEASVYDALQLDSGYARIYFPGNIMRSEGKKYIVQISASDKVNIASCQNDMDTPYVIGLYKSNAFLKELYFLVCIFISIFTLIVFICKQLLLDYLKLFLVSFILLGILFCFVFTPFSVPDESSHIDTAYRLSNKILSVEDTGISEAIYKRTEDIFTDISSKRMLGLEQYRWLYESGIDSDVSGELKIVFAADNTNNTSEIFYLPAALGLTVGRLLGLSFIGIIYCARFFNLMVSGLIIYAAVKKIPVGKSILCVLSLLPITIQEVASCSYDALIIAVSFLFIAYSISLWVSEQPIKLSEGIILLITGILLSVCKGCVYLPLVFLIPFVIIRKSNIKKAMPCIILGSVIIILCGLSMYAEEIFNMLSRTQEYAYAAQRSTQLYSAGYLIKHPYEVFRILENTIYQNSDFYLETIVGGLMGSLQVSVNTVLQYAYIFMLLMTTICQNGKCFIFSRKSKIVFWIIIIMSAGLVLLSMLINCTTFGYNAVAGVQGRYFMPILPLILLSIRGKRLFYNKKDYLLMIYIMYFLGLCTLSQVIINLYM